MTNLLMTSNWNVVTHKVPQDRFVPSTATQTIGTGKVRSGSLASLLNLRSELDRDSIDSVLLETARDMLDTGLMDRAGYEKITMRHAKKRFAAA